MTRRRLTDRGLPRWGEPRSKRPSPFPCFRVKSQQVGSASERLSWPVLRLAAIAIVAWTQPKAAQMIGKNRQHKGCLPQEARHTHHPNTLWTQEINVSVAKIVLESQTKIGESACTKDKTDLQEIKTNTMHSRK